MDKSKNQHCIFLPAPVTSTALLPFLALIFHYYFCLFI